MYNDYNNINNNNNRWIGNEEDSDFSEDSWNDKDSSITDLSYIYVNNMNTKNNDVKSKNVVLAGLQSVIDMCTPPESISDIAKNSLTNEDVIDWVEKEFVVLDEELKYVNAKKQKNNIEKRRGMLKGIRNLVHRKSQLDVEAQTVDTANSKNEVMIMSFVRPEIIPESKGRLRAGARETPSRSIYSKYSQTSDLDNPKRVLSKTQETQTLKNKDISYSTGTKTVTSTSSSTMQTKATIDLFSSSNKTQTESTSETKSSNKVEGKEEHKKEYVCCLCSSCAENDALPPNTKVSTMSTDNLKVIHISLGSNNALNENCDKRVCFKCLKGQGHKKKLPKLSFSKFSELTEKNDENLDTLKDILKESIPRKHSNVFFKVERHTLMSKNKKHRRFQTIKTARLKCGGSDRDGKIESSSITSIHTIKTTSLDESRFTNPTTATSSKAVSIGRSDRTFVRRFEKSLAKSTYRSTEEEKKRAAKIVSNGGTEKDFLSKEELCEYRSVGMSTESTTSNMSSLPSKVQKQLLSNSPTQYYSSSSTTDTSDSIFLIECGPGGNNSDVNLKEVNTKGITNKIGKSLNVIGDDQKKGNNLEKEKLSQEEINKQKLTLESIKELNENGSNDFSQFTYKKISKIPSNKTIIIASKPTLKTYNVETPSYLTLSKGAYGDSNVTKKKEKLLSKDNPMRNALLSIENFLNESRKKSDDESIKSLKAVLNSNTKKIRTIQNKSRKTTSDNSHETGTIETKTFSDEVSWHENITQIAKQIKEQMYQSPSESDSEKLRLLNLKVENPDGIDIESERVAVVPPNCQCKVAKRFNMAQLFGQGQPCECEECVKNRPMEIRYATTKISKFQRYSTFEIYKSSKYKPKFLSTHKENIFVMKNKNLL